MDHVNFNSIFDEVKVKLIKALDDNLKPNLHYHNSFHTLDVLEQVENIAKLEDVENPEDIFILRMSALFHDSGFLYVYANHEEKSCEIMQEELKQYNLPDEMIQKIAHLILMTKLPPDPTGLLEKIICDADLDYLGRDDFFEISETLKAEFIEYGFVKDDLEWQEKQIKFFEFQKYFTLTSLKRRAPKKDEIYQQLVKKYQTERNKA